MIKTTLNFNINNLQKMRNEKKTLDLEHIVQRGFVWSAMQQSLLIHSILSSFPIPPIYCLKISSDKETTYSVLDGKQRIISILDYVAGKYALDSKTPSITFDEKTIDLADKYFLDLPLDIQQEILHFKLLIYGFEDISEAEINELFYRLNNGYLLNKTQKSLSCMDFSTASFIKSLLNDKFFSEICKFSNLQRKNSDDMATLIQSMMLLDNRYYNYEYSSISADEVMRYATYIKNDYSEEQRERLFDIIDYLEKVFPTQEKMLKKINIPMVILAADIAMGNDYNSIKNIYRVGPMYFRQWFSYFFDECYEEYKQYCSSGSTKKEKTLKRIETMECSLKEYFELEDISKLEQPEGSPSIEDGLEEFNSFNLEKEECENTSTPDNNISIDEFAPEKSIVPNFFEKPPEITMDSEETE